jgi:hypothetical protein
VSTGILPECATVHWRPRVDEQRLGRQASLWTLTTVAHVVPFLIAAGLLVALQPLAFPVSLICVAHAWIVPALYAQRGANVVRPGRRADADPERVAVGLLGDLVGHAARELHGGTGLVLERGSLGVWLVGEGGALLVRPGGRRVHCYCVRVAHPELPSGDRIAHLLLALRADEQGFATVANLSFSGAVWRVRARLAPDMRPALAAARRDAAAWTPRPARGVQVWPA